MSTQWADNGARRRPGRVGKVLRWAILVIVIGGGMIAGEAFLRKQIDAESGWPVVDATVASVRTHTSTHRNSSTHRTTTTTSYTEVVSYAVGGQAYQVESRRQTSGRAAVGSARRVRYDPALPSRSSIVGDQEAGASKLRVYGIITLAVGVLIIPVGIGGGALLDALRRRR